MAHCRMRVSPTPRNAFSEWFFIDDNKIRIIYTAMFDATPDQPIPNWPPPSLAPAPAK